MYIRICIISTFTKNKIILIKNFEKVNYLGNVNKYKFYTVRIENMHICYTPSHTS